MRASVLVATRDRAERLRALLDSFRTMAAPRGGWELLVVDNGSTDGTAAVLAEAQASGTLPLIRLEERRPGKPIALNAGLARARSDIIAFTDDDCVVTRGWLVSIVTAFEADPGLGCVGGRVELGDPADRRVAIRRNPEERALTSPRELYGFIIGANMAFTRRTLEDIGPFDPLVGPGAPIPSGNDIDLIYRAYRSRHRIRYLPNILVYHHHGRQTDAAVASVRRGYLIGRGAFYGKYVLAGDVAILRLGLGEVLESLRELCADLIGGRGARPQLRRLEALARGFWTRLRLTVTRAGPHR